MNLGYIVAPIACTAIFGGIGGYIFGVLYRNKCDAGPNQKQDSTGQDRPPLSHLHNILIGSTGALIVVALGTALTQYDFDDIYRYYYRIHTQDTLAEHQQAAPSDGIQGNQATDLEGVSKPEKAQAPTDGVVSKENKVVLLWSSFSNTYLILIGLSLVGGFASIRVFRHTGDKLIEEMKKRLESIEHTTEENKERAKEIRNKTGIIEARDHMFLAKNRIESGHPDEAIKHLRKAIELNPTARAYALLAYAEYDEGHSATDCILTINKGLDLAKNNPDTDNSDIGALYYDRANYAYFSVKGNEKQLEENISSIIMDLEAAIKFDPKLAEFMFKDEEIKELRETTIFKEKFGRIQQ